MIAVTPRFIACRAGLPDARIVLFGIPFEGTVNLRTGADRGPRDLRVLSDSIETYSPALDRDLEDLAICDLGDCELGEGRPRERLDRAREEIRGFWRPGLVPVMLGGDHTATLPVIEALAPALPELRVLQLDAHPDLREEFLGERHCYASALARVMEVVPPERVYQVGMRTGDRSEFRRRAPHLYPAHAIPPVEAVRSLLPELGRHPLYVTLDIDVLDPSEAPGTGSPEPCGMTAGELLQVIRLLDGCQVIGTDLVEVAQAWDPSGRTAITAAWLLREAILTWWGR